MDLAVDLSLGATRLRTLTVADAALVVEATRAELGRALWGARPVGPYSPEEAREALEEWSLGSQRQISYGIVENERIVGAVGLMLGGDDSAELAYWVRPESRRRGIALCAVRAFTDWAHEHTELTRLWLEIDPKNTASQELARKAGYRFEERLPLHCRSWVSDDPATDRWHDCLIWTPRW